MIEREILGPALGVVDRAGRPIRVGAPVRDLHWFFDIFGVVVGATLAGDDPHVLFHVTYAAPGWTVDVGDRWSHRAVHCAALPVHVTVEPVYCRECTRIISRSSHAPECAQRGAFPEIRFYDRDRVAREALLILESRTSARAAST